MGDQLTAQVLPPIQHLLAKKFYQQCHYHSGLSKQDSVWLARQNNEIYGALRLTTLDEHLLLRSMVIRPDLRGQGFGTRFLELVVPSIKESCWCFPFTHLKSFYQQSGFHESSINDAPQAIQKKFNIYVNNGKNILLMCRVKSY